MSETPIKLYQSVAANIVERMLNGEFAGGDKLPSERDLAIRYAVSRATIREACVALEIQGWVESRRGAGIFINRDRPNDARLTDFDVGPFELLEARHLIEGEAAALAAAMITEEQLTDLAHCIERMESAPNSPEGESADGDFHCQIARATRNSIIVENVQRMWAQRYRSPLCQEIFGRARDAGVTQPVDDHKAILGALAARDSDGARRSMHVHIDGVIDCVLAATENDERAQVRHRRSAVHAKLKAANIA